MIIQLFSHCWQFRNRQEFLVIPAYS